MIFNYLDNPTIIVISAIVMIAALMLHNVVQAWVASRLGDNSARFSGFMGFEPQQHLEPMGVLFLFILGFGWPKTIPVNSRNLRGKGRNEAIVWYSGPATYLAIGFLSYLAAVIFLRLGGPDVGRAFAVAGDLAILHAVINLFPVYPLDGARAALAWGNRDVRQVVQQIANFGILGFIVVFMALSFTGITGAIMGFFRSIIFTVLDLIPGL
jgi:Zn-dependent protease